MTKQSCRRSLVAFRTSAKEGAAPLIKHKRWPTVSQISRAYPRDPRAIISDFLLVDKAVVDDIAVVVDQTDPAQFGHASVGATPDHFAVKGEDSTRSDKLLCKQKNRNGDGVASYLEGGGAKPELDSLARRRRSCSSGVLSECEG